jgi:hypothetical protein
MRDSDGQPRAHDRESPSTGRKYYFVVSLLLEHNAKASAKWGKRYYYLALPRLAASRRE